MSEWQLIETAPKDGTEILVYEYKWNQHWYSVMSWIYNNWHTPAVSGYEYEEEITKPTHWKLIEPPKD